MGIYLYRSNGNNISNNTANSNTRYGIYLSYSNGNNIPSNTANSNSYYGIALGQSHNNVLQSNTFCSNTIKDILNSGTGNTGSNNTCNTTTSWNDANATGCTYNCFGFSGVGSAGLLSTDWVSTHQLPAPEFMSEAPALVPAPTPTTQPASTVTNSDNQTIVDTQSIAENQSLLQSSGLLALLKGVALRLSNLRIRSPVGIAEAHFLGSLGPFFQASSTNESYTIWETNISQDVTNFATVTTNVGQLNVTGKLYLYATLYSSTGQLIAYNISSFYITDQDLSLTLETDKRVYKPNETVNIMGEVTNHGSSAQSCNLTIKKDGAPIYTVALSLTPGETHTYLTNTSSNTSFALEGTVGGVNVTESVAVELPRVNVSVTAPDMVGLGPFNVGVLLENTDNVSADLTVSINSTWDVTIPEGQSRLLETTLNITANRTLNVTVSGDFDWDVQKEIIFGEDARINLTPESMYLTGPAEIPFTVTNTGILDTAFNATFSLSGQTISAKFFVPQGENISDSVSFNLTQGTHTLSYTSPFETVTVPIVVFSPTDFVVSAITPTGRNFTAGEDVPLVFTVENIGGSEGEAILTVEMPDFEDTNRTWIGAGAAENMSFNFTIPDDLEEKSYKGFYELDGEREEFTFFVQGANISVSASLNKKVYQAGETALFTMTVTNNRNRDLSLYSRVKFNEYDNVTYFNLTGLENETLTFMVPVNFTDDNKLLYSVYMDTGRSLYINSMYVYEKNATAPLTLYTDKDVYTMGETVTIHIEDVSAQDVLNLTAPNFTYSDTISGSTTLQFTLPEMQSGTYYIRYTFGTYSGYHPFDVVGYSARILEADLDKERYYNGDTVLLNMTIETNRAASGVLRTRMYDPTSHVIDEFEANKTLNAGENAIQVNRTLTTSATGVHRITYTFYADMIGQSLAPLVSSLEYFDAEVAGINLTLPPNVELLAASPNVTGINVTHLNLSELNETYIPAGVILQSAYLINATGAGNFTLRFTNISNATRIVVYKIDPTSVPPSQWLVLDTTTTTDTVTITMEVGDPPVVFARRGASSNVAAAPSLTPIGITALVGLLIVVASRRIRKKSRKK